MDLPAHAAPPDQQALAIFARARAVLEARTFPSTIKYAVKISGLRNGTWAGRTYDAFEDWPDGSIFTRAISREETDAPVKPVPFCFFGLGAPKRSGLELPGVMGIPKLAVTYSFGLATPGESAAPNTSASGLKTIGVVHAVSRKYDVKLVGEEPVDGNACWHLALTPLGNPGTYRVRDLWVDEASYQTRRLVTDGNFTIRGTGSGRWTVSYQQIGDAWYLESEVSKEPVYGPDGRYDRGAVQFIGVAADPRENLDFGIAGSSLKEAELTEPSN